LSDSQKSLYFAFEYEWRAYSFSSFFILDFAT
jgi:hypothetical protein